LEIVFNNDEKNKNLLDINIDALYNILKQNQGDVNDAIKSKKKAVVITSDLLALVDEQTKITALLAKAFNQKKLYSKPTNNNLRTSSTTSSANKKQEYVKFDDKKEEKKVDEKKKDMSKVKCYNCKNEGHFAKDCKKSKVKDYEYYKTKMLLVKKDKDEQVLLTEDHAWMGSSSDSDQEINANMVFMAQIEKVISESEASSSSSDDKFAEIDDQEILFDKMSHQLLEFDENMRMLKNTVLEKDLKIYELEECVRNKDLEITKCLERLNECEKKLHKIRHINQTIHMIMPSKDKMYNGRKGIGFENPSYFCKAKDLRPTLYDERVIGLRYMLMFLTHSNEALEIEKFKKERENKIEFAYDYGSLNVSYVNGKIIFLDDYFQEIINPDSEKIDSPFQQTSSLKPYVLTVILEKIIIDLEDEVVSLFDKEKENLKIIESLKSKGCESSENEISKLKNQSENAYQVIEKGYDRVENSNMIAPGMFKLSVSQSVLPNSVTKTSCASNSVETKLKIKSHKRTSLKDHDKQVNKDVLRANKAFVHFSDLDTISSVRRPKPSGVIAFDCNNVRNALCNARINASVDVNDLFVFDDVSIRKSHVSKMLFRKKPSASLNVPSRNKLNKSLPRIIRKWLPKLQSLAEPVAKWIPKICLWIIDSRCSKHMTGNRALLTNFVKTFLGTVRFGNNDFAEIVGYGDVVIGSMMTKKVYYVEGLGDNLFSVVKFYDKGLELAFRKSTCFIRNEDGVDLLIGDRSSNFYTISPNEVASNSSACLLAKASSSQSWLWHQRLSHLNFATINNLVKNNLVRGLPKMKFKNDHLCSACEQGKIHRKHHKSKTTFASNKPLYLLHMDLCRPMRVKSINEKRYVLVVVNDYSQYAWVFFLHSKDEASEVIISFIKKTQVNLQL
nr:retrovirus-related Pol polyprotein from transposon TNT 1-94 [Tanacetum cinerariifolium]